MPATTRQTHRRFGSLQAPPSEGDATRALEANVTLANARRKLEEQQVVYVAIDGRLLRSGVCMLQC